MSEKNNKRANDFHRFEDGDLLEEVRYRFTEKEQIRIFDHLKEFKHLETIYADQIREKIYDLVDKHGEAKTLELLETLK